MAMFSFGTCHKLTIITTAVKPTKADVDLSWKQQIADTPIQVNTSKVYKTLIANKVKYKLTATDNSDLGSYSFTIENYDQHVILDFTMPKGLPKEQYNVELQPFNFTFFNDTGQNLSVFVLSGNSVYNTSVESLRVEQAIMRSAEAFQYAMATASGTLTTVAAVVITAQSVAGANQGNVMGNSLMLLLMLSGPQVLLVEKVLNGSIPYAGSFSFGNPFKSWTENEECDLPDAFARNDIVCSIFANYGEDLIVLMVAIPCCILITVLTTVLLKKINKDRKKTHAVLQWIQGTFGLPFFIGKLEGSQFEGIVFSMWNLQTLDLLTFIYNCRNVSYQ
jgi:hypothetical protein